MLTETLNIGGLILLHCFALFQFIFPLQSKLYLTTNTKKQCRACSIKTTQGIRMKPNTDNSKSVENTKTFYADNLQGQKLWIMWLVRDSFQDSNKSKKTIMSV